MKIALAQIDTRVGDFGGNAGRVHAARRAAIEGGADLVVFPELTVTGYSPRDLFYDDDFVDRAIRASDDLARSFADDARVTTVFGSIERSYARGTGAPRNGGHPGLYNVAIVVGGSDGDGATRAPIVVRKRLLPSYDVFHESRWFVSAPEPSSTFEVNDTRVGIVICEDVWDETYDVHPGADLVAAGADLLVCISASPFRAGVFAERLHHAARQKCPIVCTNLVGANDELIFDGRSFALDGEGNLTGLLPAFEEAVGIVDLGDPTPQPFPHVDAAGELFDALVLGVRDFARKNNIRRAYLGLSGGVDSALVACVAAYALGSSSVTGVALPSRYTDPRSTESARELAANLGINFEVLPIDDLHAAAESTLAGVLGEGESTARENVQSRIRMLLLNAYVNARGGLLLNTSNKTELTLGYGTLYGDMAGTLGVIADLTKPQVYDLARWCNRSGDVIPKFIVDRAPSAELRPDQVDPFDYDRDAPIADAFVRSDRPAAPAPETIGGPPLGTLVLPDRSEEFRRMARAAEHKRWQFGVVLKVSDKAFGTGRMWPISRA